MLRAVKITNKESFQMLELQENRFWQHAINLDLSNLIFSNGFYFLFTDDVN